MTEFDMHAFVEASQVRRANAFGEIPIDPLLIQQVLALMTSQEIKNQTFHNREIISKGLFPNFDSLLVDRERIRNLQLLPHRADVVQANYLEMSKDAFLEVVERDYLDGDSLSLVRELYPTDIPDDVEQFVVWARDDEVPDEDIASFIARLLQESGLTINDIILFERSRVTDTDHARVAIVEHRHIHMWIRKKQP